MHFMDKNTISLEKTKQACALALIHRQVLAVLQLIISVVIDVSNFHLAVSNSLAAKHSNFLIALHCPFPAVIIQV